MSTPDPDYEDPKELWAFFGLTFYQAQVLEQGLLNLTVALHLRGVHRVAPGTIDDLFGRLGVRTFGQVLRPARKLVRVPADLDDRLQDALRHRNRLAHRFFVENDVEILSDAGRRRMIGELRDMHAALESVDNELDPLWQAAWKKLGMTQEMYEAALGNMRAEAAAQDGVPESGTDGGQSPWPDEG